ncbi:MAG: hypothetical protein R3C49_23860 [Planctomycetaceae bacterium]
MTDPNFSSPADPASVAARKRFWARLVVFAVLIAIALLKPKVEAWLERQKAAAEHKPAPSTEYRLPDIADPPDVEPIDSELTFETTDPTSRPSGGATAAEKSSDVQVAVTESSSAASSESTPTKDQSPKSSSKGYHETHRASGKARPVKHRPKTVHRTPKQRTNRCVRPTYLWRP